MRSPVKFLGSLLQVGNDEVPSLVVGSSLGLVRRVDEGLTSCQHRYTAPVLSQEHIEISTKRMGLTVEEAIAIAGLHSLTLIQTARLKTSQELISTADGTVRIVITLAQVGIVASPSLITPLRIPTSTLRVECGVAAEEQLGLIVPGIGILVVLEKTVVDTVQTTGSIFFILIHQVRAVDIVVIYLQVFITASRES